MSILQKDSKDKTFKHKVAAFGNVTKFKLTKFEIYFGDKVLSDKDRTYNPELIWKWQVLKFSDKTMTVSLRNNMNLVTLKIVPETNLKLYNFELCISSPFWLWINVHT